MLISLDVGFSATGWSVYDNGQVIDCGVIKTERSKKKGVRTADETVLRAQKIVRTLKEIIERYEVTGV